MNGPTVALVTVLIVVPNLYSTINELHNRVVGGVQVRFFAN